MAYACDVCNETYKTKGILKTHLTTRKHLKKVSGEVAIINDLICKKCDKEFANNGSFKNHTEGNICDKMLRCITGNEYLTGYFTERLRYINNKPCYNYIIKNCFNKFDFSSNCITDENIIPTACSDYIKQLHQVNSSIAGTFLDYLMRRIISEKIKKPFEDQRAEKQARNTNKHINVKSHGGDVEIGITSFPFNVLDCYNKAQDVVLYKTANIVLEIFITSLCHTMSFEPRLIYQNQVDDIVNLIKNTSNLNELFIVPLEQLCLNLLRAEDTSVLLNPSLSNKTNPLFDFPADCDVVIQNTLYDIKCTGGDNFRKEMLQLLGYASLLNCNPVLNKKIDTISILNLLQGTMIKYDISHITKDQMLSYLHILTRKPN